MKGDFTRTTFKRDKRYSSVRMQQGRVQLDADWNEQLDIDAHVARTTGHDVIGPCGVPIEDGGFEVSVAPDHRDLFISAGRMYVDGILVELGMERLPVTFPSENAVQLPTLMVDGRPLAVDQWVEISAPGQSGQRQKITEIHDKQRTLVFSRNVRAALRNARAPQVQRVTTYLTQADYPEPDKTFMRPMPVLESDGDISFLAYLDVWEQHVTSLQDGDMREVALGVSGPDTTTRTKVIAQVKLARTRDTEVRPLDACDLGPGWAPTGAASTGLLAARVEVSEDEATPCLVPPQAGYQGLENQLYRLEIHENGGIDEATFKWSRENGSIVVSWERQDSVNPRKLTLSSMGRDSALGFAADDWVEITDDTRELLGKPGAMAQVEKVDGLVMTLKAGTISDPDNAGASDVKLEDFPLHPRVRRWDSIGAEKVTIPGRNDGWIALEQGVEIHFQGGGAYQTGDAWLIPARTITGQVEWPQDQVTGDPRYEAKHFISHHYCPLALLKYSSESRQWEVVSDCRKQFPPLSELVRFFYVSGDGQEALPGAILSRPLQVGVNNGQHPVPGARVRFRVVDGSGQLVGTEGESCSGVMADNATVVVVTDGHGIASCCWQLDTITPSQRVEVILLDINGRALTGISSLAFNASLSRADQVAYDPSACHELKEATTVQEAIDILCQRQPGGGGCALTVGKEGQYHRLDEAIHALIEQNQLDICLCMLPGEHSLPGLELSGTNLANLNLHIRGCGRGSRIQLKEPMKMAGIHSITLRDLMFEMDFPIESNQRALAFSECKVVDISSCIFEGTVAEGALLEIVGSDWVRLRDNELKAAMPASLTQARKIFAESGNDFLAQLYSPPDNNVLHSRVFLESARGASRTLAHMSAAERKEMLTALQRVLRNPQVRRMLSAGEILAFQKFGVALRAESLALSSILNLLLDLRRAGIKARPGVALVLDIGVEGKMPAELEIAFSDEDDVIKMTGNRIAGVLSLYGLPDSIDMESEILNAAMLKILEARLQEGQARLSGMWGTLQMHGNHVVRMTISRQTVMDLRSMVEGSDTKNTLSDLFGRLQCSDNVFEGEKNILLGQDLALAGNAFTFTATSIPEGDAGPAGVRGIAALVIGDAVTYLGNHGTRPNSLVVDTSRVHDQAANLHLYIN